MDYAGSLLLCGLFSNCVELGLLCSYGTWASHCGGFSYYWAQALGLVGFIVSAHRLNSFSSWDLEYRLYICGTQARLPHGMWSLPGSGIEPVSPALAGRFFIPEPPGKPCDAFWVDFWIRCSVCQGLFFCLWVSTYFSSRAENSLLRGIVCAPLKSLGACLCGSASGLSILFWSPASVTSHW